MKFTNETVLKAPLPTSTSDAIYPDDGKGSVPGLYVRCRKSGSRTFVIQWQQGARWRRSTVGKVGVITLDDARQKARKLLVGIGDGIDPIAAKAHSRAEGAKLFEPLADEYLNARAKNMKPLSLDQCRRHLKVYWKPLHRLSVSKIDRQLIATELRIIAKARGPVAANRSRSTLSAFFAWLIGEGVCDDNPVMGTNKATTNGDRERTLTDAELVAIWNGAGEGDYANIVRLLMLTGQRRDEIADLQRTEIVALDDPAKAMIDLPASRTKNSRPHLVPLSAPAISILRGIAEVEGRALVFGEGQGGFSGFSRAKERLDKLCGVTGWTLHDLRRTMSTQMHEMGVEPHIVEALLNHVSGHKKGVAGTYNKAGYLSQKRAALDLWAGHLQTIVAQANGANVTRLQARLDSLRPGFRR